MNEEIGKQDEEKEREQEREQEREDEYWTIFITALAAGFAMWMGTNSLGIGLATFLILWEIWKFLCDIAFSLKEISQKLKK